MKRVGQEYYAKNGTYIHLNVAGNTWLSNLTYGVGPKIGLARPLSPEKAQLIARILHNFARMHKNQQYFSKGAFISFYNGQQFRPSSQDHNLDRLIQFQDKLHLKEIKECSLIQDFEIHEWVSAFFAQSQGLIDEEKTEFDYEKYNEFEDETPLINETTGMDTAVRPILYFEGNLPSEVVFNSANHSSIQISNTTWNFLTWVGLGLWESPGLPEHITSEEGRILAIMSLQIKRLHQLDARLVQLKGMTQKGGIEIIVDQSADDGLKTDVGRANIDAAITMLANTPGTSIKIR